MYNPEKKQEAPENKLPSGEKLSRRGFIKKALMGAGVIAMSPGVLAAAAERKEGIHAQFKKTNEQFKNGEFVWDIEANGEIVGEFWPTKAVNLVTKDTDPALFEKETDDMLEELGGVATAPDGMTSGAYGSYKMEGKSLSHGRECGDGKVHNYGIIHVDNTGYNIKFTHKKEIQDFDSFYEKTKKENGTLFFLPSIYRKGRFLNSENIIDKAFIRRKTPNNGEQIGVVVFHDAVTYNQAREILVGLNRPGASETTHIYMLDGGPTWGQAVKEVNGEQKTIGTRNKNAVTNYLVFY